jgi:hypothetical protein
MSRKRKKSKSGGARSAPSAPASSSSGSSGGGSLSRMRGGLQGMFGSSKKSSKPPTVLSRVLDILMWIVTAAVIVFVIYARFFRHR